MRNLRYAFTEKRILGKEEGLDSVRSWISPPTAFAIISARIAASWLECTVGRARFLNESANSLVIVATPDL